jgi:hypothetical protein
MLDFQIFRPIRNLGLFFGVLGAVGIALHLAFLKDPQYSIGFQIFVVFVSVVYLVIGWNIVARNRWGFRSLKLILYLLYPGFPLGYYFARRTLKYIEEYNIDRYFRKTLKI